MQNVPAYSTGERGERTAATVDVRLAGNRLLHVKRRNVEVGAFEAPSPA